jgi:multiple sugar transport system substrate-binding protein
MTFVRSARRALVAGISLTACLAMVACGGGGGAPEGGGGAGGEGGGGGGGADFSKRGPIEYWQGKDTAGATKPLIDGWNKDHPDEKVTLKELPDNADLQRQQMIQNTQIKNPAMAVLSVDVVWTAEFAANGYIVELPKDQFSTEGLLPATVDSGTYFNKLYAMPVSSDGGLLYYRKDLLDKHNVEAPTTWDEMKQACEKIQQGENNDKLDCYAGQYQKYEGLTVNFAEAVNSAGGEIIGPDGKPKVNSPEAAQGLQALVDMFEDGTIPKGAITWKEEEGRTAFQKGNLIFHRNWPYVYALASKTDGSSEVAGGKFGVAPLPGLSGPGVSSLGGHNYAIAANAENKGTAADFVKFAASAEIQRAVSQVATVAPTATELYEDEALVKKYPFFPILRKSIETAKPRPKAVKYGDVTLAIQDAAYSSLQGQATPQDALASLQTKLESLTQQ